MKKTFIILLMLIFAFNCALEAKKTKPIKSKGLAAQFPGYIIKYSKKSYLLSAGKSNGLYSDFLLKKTNSSYFPLFKSTFSNLFLVFNQQDTVFFNNLKLEEILSVEENLYHTFISLRLLSGKNYPFPYLDENIQCFLIDRNAPASYKTEYSSYKSLLSDLNKKYPASVVYSRFGEVKKVNNHLEFNTIFEIKQKQRVLTGELKAHFDLNNELDLIMVFIYNDKN